MEPNKVNSIDEYIANCPEEVQKKLKDLRATIKASAPNAVDAFHWAIILHRDPSQY